MKSSRFNLNEASDEDSNIFRSSNLRNSGMCNAETLPRLNFAAKKVSDFSRKRELSELGKNRASIHLAGQSRIKRSPLPLEALNQFMKASSAFSMKDKLRANKT